MTPTPRREPRTESGRAVLRHLGPIVRLTPKATVRIAPLVELVLDIESEARALALSELEEAVGGLGTQAGVTSGGSGWLFAGFDECRSAVIQLIRDKQSEEKR